MFYYHTIRVYTVIGQDRTPRGTIIGPVIQEVAKLDVDVQNASINKIKQTYGIDSRVSFEIYSPVCKDIKEDAIIEFNGNFYKVDSIVLWDEFAQGSIFNSYMQFVVSKYEGQLKVEDVIINENESQI